VASDDATGKPGSQRLGMNGRRWALAFGCLGGTMVMATVLVAAFRAPPVPALFVAFGPFGAAYLYFWYHPWFRDRPR